MDSARTADRGVGPTKHTSLLGRARLQVIGVALVVACASLPAAALTAPGERTPSAEVGVAAQTSHAAAVPAGTAAAGSDQLAALQRALRRVEAQLANARTRVSTLTLRRDGLAADLRDARTRSAEVTESRSTARKELAKAARAEERARKEHRKITAQAKVARTKFAAAEAAMASAQARLNALVPKADKAATRAARAASKVKRAASGSAARRKAFTQWQLDAVAERAAHARMVLAEDAAADRFVEMEGAESALTLVDSALAESERTLARAGSERSSASRRAADLTQERTLARTEIATLTASLKTAEAARAKAARTVKKLSSERTSLKARVAKLEDRLASSSLRPGPSPSSLSSGS